MVENIDIRKLLTSERISFNLKGKTKEDVIDELIDILYEDDVVRNKKVFKQAVMDREKEFPTGIDNGVGIPHGKSSVVSTPAIALGISKEGIDFGSIYGKPTHLIFLIAIPEKDDSFYLKTISQVCGKLIHKEVINSLKKAKSYDDIIEILDMNKQTPQ